jgi:tripartite-type tricarboxylate transporter receptor subunit TctC
MKAGLFKLLCMCAALGSISLEAAAQEFPTRPITLVHILGAGGPTDALARAIASSMSEQLGKPVIVENRPGASGAIASMTVARAKADGYTLLFTANTAHTLTPLVQKGTKFDPVKDFTPITMIGKWYNVLVVNKNVPAKTFPELIELAKSRPQGLTMATFGMATRIVLARLAAESGVSLLDVPYADGAKATQALLSGDVDTFFDGAGLARTRVDEGLYRAVAVLSPKRMPSFAELPTVAEYIPGFENPLWAGIMAPAGLPSEIAEKLRKAVVASFDLPRVRTAGAALGITEFVGNSSQELASIIAQETRANAELVERHKLIVAE